jgi:hypothetical protein
MQRQENRTKNCAVEGESLTVAKDITQKATELIKKQVEAEMK